MGKKALADILGPVSAEQKGNKVNGAATDRTLGKATSEKIYNFFTASKLVIGKHFISAISKLTLARRRRGWRPTTQLSRSPVTARPTRHSATICLYSCPLVRHQSVYRSWHIAGATKLRRYNLPPIYALGSTASAASGVGAWAPAFRASTRPAWWAR